ncbi:type II restriction enzyme MjaVIP [Thioploca ingrica]|uniref:Type II restriction enzyme MjaVIP n=1 Tax=Thioploca ingrica TaxID=40754 RepID=A0A090AM39_9GAMM|nr:type II restriction enzyme MjaVIP [Thioploca ingrica]
MKFEDLVKLYLEKKERLGANVHQHISEILREAKKLHKRDWQEQPTRKGDHEQSWRAFKGKDLEKLIECELRASECRMR